MNDSYKYILNGVEHEIPSQHHIVIQQNPLSETILISQKYILKYFHDWMQIHEMEYFITHHTLLGHTIFQGIHIFQPFIEVSIPQHHFEKIIKMKNVFQKDDFILQEFPHHLILSSSFFSRQHIQLMIYSLNPFSSTQYEIIYPENQQKHTFDLYDIYPLQISNYEDFQVFTPHKPTSILQNAHFNLHFIQFKENKSFISQKREIIEEPNESISNLFPESLFEPFSFMKNTLLSKKN